MTDVLPVFIGGTGRSGTTILARTLGAYRGVFASPLELRFITDPDGLISLHSALVEQWSPWMADVALRRFDALMRSLRSRSLGRYPTTGLSRVFGTASYDGHVRAFQDALRAFAFTGSWAGTAGMARRAMMRLLRGWRIDLPGLGRIHYSSPCSDESYFTAARRLVMGLMGDAAETAGADVFVDHTPTNALHAAFLQALTPDARVVHITRDPRDVIASFTERVWGPTSVQQAAQVVRDVTVRWCQVRRALRAESYIEVRFEEFASSPAAVLRHIGDWLFGGARERGVLPDLSRHHVGRWREHPQAFLIESLVSTDPVLRPLCDASPIG